MLSGSQVRGAMLRAYDRSTGKVSKRNQSARVTKYCRIAQITPATNSSASVLQGAKGHIDR
jgi:hypothetical protein